MLPTIFLAILFLLLPLSASAMPTCTINATPLLFGKYTPEAIKNGVARLTVNCLGTGAVNYKISLMQGHGNQYAERQLKSAARSLTYNVFLDPACSVIWGDGTQGTAVIRSAGNSPLTHSHVVYGCMPARQRFRAATYTDALTVNLEYE